MIHYCPGDVYYNKDVDITYNPVCIIDNTKFSFSSKVIYVYPIAYLRYKDMVNSTDKDDDLLGEIQLVDLGNKRLVMNGYCIDDHGHINKLAFTKTLVELCNIAYEYNLSVGIEYALGSLEPVERKWLAIIIEEVFKNVDIDVYVYNRYPKTF